MKFSVFIKLSLFIPLVLQTLFVNAQLPVPAGRPLREIVAEKYGDTLLIGATIAGSSLDNAIAMVMDREFSYVTPENDFKHATIRGSMGWNWAPADQWLSHIQQKGQVLRVHGPIAPQCNTWAKTDTRTAAELEEELEVFMTALCIRYNGVEGIEYMDVVNEIALDNGAWFGPRPGTDEWENPWEQIGRDTDPNRTPLYIKQAFAIANAYAPDIKQILNNHAHPGSAGMEKVKQTILYLRERGYRVDGLGWQGHVDIDWVTPQNLQALADLVDWCNENNVEFHVTEFSAWRNSKYTQSLEDQAYTYRSILDVMLQKLDTVPMGWNTWHVSDIEGWNNELEPSLFDSKFKPKPAYYDTQLALETRGDYSVKNSVQFEVRHLETNELIQDFTLRLGDSVQIPTSGGSVLFPEIYSGRYRLVIENPEYNTINQPHVNIYRDTTITVYLTPAEYEVKFQINEEVSGKPVSTVSTTIGETIEKTNPDGQVVFVLRSGSYTANFEKTGFNSFEESYTIVSDTTINVLLEKTHANVKVSVTNDDQPVNNAQVIFGEDTVYTTALGLVNFTLLPVNQIYRIEISKEYFKSKTVDFTPISDTTLNIELEKSHVTLRFELPVDEYNVEDAFMVVQEDTSTFTSQGIASFYRLPVDDTYDYQLFVDSTMVFSDQITLSGDTIVVLSYTSDNTHFASDHNEILFYPNPAKDWLYLTTDIKVESVQIFDSKGGLLYTSTGQKTERQINLSGFSEGIYWIRIIKEDGQEPKTEPFVIRR